MDSNKTFKNPHVRITISESCLCYLTFVMPANPSTVKIAQIKTISLKSRQDLSEAWVQQVLFENPALLDLGPSVAARAMERRQSSGGRLDLLLEDEDADVRYEVEIQLGATDETHIIRTIEYWDIERKRYPNYDHVAVIVAEEITSRFFNVISLFNSTLPIIALKMTALEQPDGSIGLFFTKVLDLASTAQIDDDDPIEQTDRTYWEKKSTKKVLQLTDYVFGIIQQFEPSAQPSYNKFYLGIWVEGRANNFAVFRPRKNYCLIDIKLDHTDENDELVRAASLDEITYKLAEGRYRMRLDENIKNAAQTEALHKLLRKACQG